MYHQLLVKDRPLGVNLDQFLLETSLGVEELSNKYSLQFEDGCDEISEVKVSLICDDEGNFFIFIARPTLPEAKISVYSSVEAESTDKCTESIEIFLKLLKFDLDDMIYRIDEA